MKQVWFARVHADIGGGYPEEECGSSWALRLSGRCAIRRTTKGTIMTDIALYSASCTKLPGRNEHLRKIAQRIADDTREYPADDPSRAVDPPAPRTPPMVSAASHWVP